MISNNLLLLIVVVLLVISEVNKNNQINNLKKEKFEQSSDTATQIIDAVSISNLSSLATNLISNNGQNLNLEYKNFNVATSGNKADNINMYSNRINLHSDVIKILSFRRMIAPFYDFNNTNVITMLERAYWYLCDGRTVNGVGIPNLQDRFIYGGHKGVSSVGNIGGLARVTLTKEQIPAHTHNVTSGQFTTDGPCGAHKCNNHHGFKSTEIGGGQSHENMPPYMVIAYFIYLPPDN